MNITRRQRSLMSMRAAHLSMLVQVSSILFKVIIALNIHNQTKIIILLFLHYTSSRICYFKVLANKFHFLLQLQKQGTGKFYIMDFTICTLHLLLLLKWFSCEKREMDVVCKINRMKKYTLCVILLREHECNKCKKYKIWSENLTGDTRLRLKYKLIWMQYKML